MTGEMQLPNLPASVLNVPGAFAAVNPRPRRKGRPPAEADPASLDLWRGQTHDGRLHNFQLKAFLEKGQVLLLSCLVY